MFFFFPWFFLHHTHIPLLSLSILLFLFLVHSGSFLQLSLSLSLFLSLALSLFFLLFLFLPDSRTLSPSISHKQILSHTHIDHWQRSGNWRSTQIGILHFCFCFFLVWLVLFYCSDFFRLMRKIAFVFQIFWLCFVFLFWLWYALVCNHWDREAQESEEQKRKGVRENFFLFYSTGYYFKGEYCLEVLQ